MISINTAILAGNLARSPEIRHLQSGTPVCDLRLAINERYKNKAGDDVENTVFVDVVVWGKQAEASAKYLQKGSAVLLQGKLQYEAWEKDGQKHSRLKIRADYVHFLGKQKSATAEPGTSAGGTATNADRAGDIPPF